MSSTTKDDTSESSPPQNKLAIAQKKLKVLKNALKSEREERKNVESQLEAVIKSMEQLKNVISEKENKFLQLYQENANLQEALLRETKGTTSTVKKQPLAKPPLFVGNNSQKGKSETSSSASSDIVNLQQSEAMELLQQKCKGYEEQLLKNDELFKQQNYQIEQSKIEIHNLQQLFEQRLQEINEERNHFEQELKVKEKEWNFKFQEKDAEIKKLNQEFEKKITAIQEDNQQTLAQLNLELDKNLRTGEFIDSLNEKIATLEKELQRGEDEIKLRKEVIDSMSNSLMKHERESGELAQKLSMMKNQILEQQVGSGIGKKFAAVKLGRLNKKTVSFEFVEDKTDDFYLIIDSKTSEISVNFDNIDEVQETKDGKLNILYFIPGDSGNMLKRNENYECFEIEEFLKVYTNIKASLILKNQHKIQKQNTFNPQTKPLTPSMSKNTRKFF
ncbi:UNKNOWN [Stylonychia lemnae]|uniref:Uncharacterized protein n=1 Tax=Stylonychia lemnae TaxID=5949 RepID=A0A077ZWW3_STYLE|nr:UNKNOWN [Stylonychia lemnae]|eukprot:CDW74319.1 UNKNOWN [Stylonychia lemnae]